MITVILIGALWTLALLAGVVWNARRNARRAGRGR